MELLLCLFIMVFLGAVKTLSRCPGYYCGRSWIENGNESMWSACGSCASGFRVNISWACEECHDSPTTYDWMYLSFMVLVGMFIITVVCIMLPTFIVSIIYSLN